MVKRWRPLVASGCFWVGGAALVSIMLLTVADVVLRSAFDSPIRGTLEIVELLLTITFFVALPGTFLREEHVVVDIVDGIAPRAVPALRFLAVVFGVVALAIMAWRGWISAMDALQFHDVTADLSIPKIWYWIPLLVGMVGSAIAAFATLFWRR